MASRHRLRSGVWGVLLAGGDGTRLQSLTSKIEGDSRPKQFCRILGRQTLMTQTRQRISSLIGADQMIAVVTKKHESFYGEELGELRKSSIVVQPENWGTGIAIAATVLLLLELDANAMVAFFPCDHHYSDESAFLDVMEACIRAAQDNADAIVVVGAGATYPEVEYGWIEPVRGPRNCEGVIPDRVRQFWEKPNIQTARELQRRGCLWNTFVTIGRASTFLEMLCRAAPTTIATLSAGIVGGDLESCYRRIRLVDFSRDVLTCQPEHLLVMRDVSSGWTDLGSPRRVLHTLARHGSPPAWQSWYSAATSCVQVEFAEPATRE